MRAIRTPKLLIAAILFVGASLVRADNEEHALKPLIEVGDRWTYRGTNVVGPGAEEYDVEVVSVQGSHIQAVCTRKRDGKEFDAIYTDDWSLATSCLGFVNRPPASFFKFPMAIGDSWPLNYESQRPRESMSSFKVEGIIKVTGWEQVAVPAGTFRVLRLEAEARIILPNVEPDIRSYTIWYSPEVRREVKMLTTAKRGNTFSSELLSYKLNE